MTRNPIEMCSGSEIVTAGGPLHASGPFGLNYASRKVQPGVSGPSVLIMLADADPAVDADADAVARGGCGRAEALGGECHVVNVATSHVDRGAMALAGPWPQHGEGWAGSSQDDA